MYIPDLTERYPEGFRSYSDHDAEYDAWKEMEREYWENERRNANEDTKHRS